MAFYLGSQLLEKNLYAQHLYFIIYSFQELRMCVYNEFILANIKHIKEFMYA